MFIYWMLVSLKFCYNPSRVDFSDLRQSVHPCNTRISEYDKVSVLSGVTLPRHRFDGNWGESNEHRASKRKEGMAKRFGSQNVFRLYRNIIGY